MNRLILAAVLAAVASAAMAHEPAVAPASAQVVDEAAAPAIAVVDAFHAALGSGERDAVLPSSQKTSWCWKKAVPSDRVRNTRAITCPPT